MDTGDQAQHTEDTDHRGGAIADQGQGQADNGHDTDAHSHVDEDLEHQSRGGTEADQTAHIVRSSGTHEDTPGDDGKLHHHDQHTAEEAQLFTHRGKDVVRVLGKQVAALGTVAIEQPLSCQAAAG